MSFIRETKLAFSITIFGRSIRCYYYEDPCCAILVAG